MDKIRVHLSVNADATKEKFQELVTLAKNRSGVFDMLSNDVPIAVELD